LTSTVAKCRGFNGLWVERDIGHEKLADTSRKLSANVRFSIAAPVKWAELLTCLVFLDG
jgi:hypothetical protein